MQYVVRDLEDLEVGRSLDARSAWETIARRWPEAGVCGLDGRSVRGWMRMMTVLQEAEEASITRGGRTVGRVALEDEEALECSVLRYR
jgi:hypothetical protein